MIYVSSISLLLKWTSPVSSRTVTPNAVERRFWKLPTISVTRAFMGATYTTLKFLRSNLPSLRRTWFSTYRIVSSAMFVLPAPVGAQISRFSDRLNAAGNTLL